MLASANPVLDPLLVTPLRHAVVNSAWGRGKIDIPPGIAKKLNDTTVVTSTTPVSPSFRPDLPKRMRVNNAPDRAKEQKFQVRDERREKAAVQQPQRQQPVEQQRGRGQEQREAQSQPQQPRGQQKRIERAPQAQGERVAAPARTQPEAQPKHERPPQAQKQQKQEQKQERGNPGKGKGKKP
jgi:flagellar biosynthesis GTPase FlhF